MRVVVSGWRPKLGKCRCGNPARILDHWCLSCAEKHADRLVSRYVRERDGRCMWPGCTVRGVGSLDAHHIQGRSYHRIRFNPDNLISLCRQDHAYAHRDKDACRTVVEDIMPGRWQHLITLRETESRIDLETVIRQFGKGRAA